MQSNRRALIAASLFLVTGYLFAQGPNRNLGNNIPIQPASPAARPPRVDDISLDVNLVNVDVVVTNKNGDPVGGMEKKQFKVFDDNVEQKITNFTTVDSPLTVAIVLEYTPFVLYYNNIYGSIGGFVQSLRDDDWGALVAFDIHPKLITDFTRDKGLLIEGLRSLRDPSSSQRGLFDAVCDTLQKLDKVSGKKAIFLLSTGLDSISRRNYSDALKMAQASDTMIYSVSMSQLYQLRNQITLNANPELNMELVTADNQLGQLAIATGGSAFTPKFDTEYPKIYDSMSRQLRNQYSIAFVPSNPKKDGKFHKLRVEVEDLNAAKDGKTDGLKARTRQGYYAPKS